MIVVDLADSFQGGCVAEGAAGFACQGDGILGMLDRFDGAVLRVAEAGKDGGDVDTCACVVAPVEELACLADVSVGFGIAVLIASEICESGEGFDLADDVPYFFV